MENSELKNRKTEVVDAIIAWLDERIDREEKDMSASEDDSSLLADSEYLQAYRSARSHMDKRITEYLAWLDDQFENALDASDSDIPSEYQEGLTDGFDRAEAAFRDIFDVKEQ